MISCRRMLLGAVVLALLPLIGSAADRHEGVASCASSLCHGATKPLGNHPIRQDEYFVWQRQDPHTRAWRTLLSGKSRKIGRVLGLDPATAPACLVCHAESAPAAARSSTFHTADGIGCEGCHGGAERWLAEHTRPGITLQEKAALGMQPLWQRETRASLCLDCHQGSAAKPITHAMMVAGHPRLVFELDTFTSLQPPHHDRDADYAARKGVYQPVADWLAGQVEAAELRLTALADGSFMHGLMPEWMAFDCTACHHPMDAARWQPARMPGAEPGAVPFADVSQSLIGFWLAAVSPADAAVWREGQRALHAAQSQGVDAVRAAARQQLANLRARIEPRIAAPGSAAQWRAMLRDLAADTSQREAPLLAEQRAMAFTVIADALRLQGAALPAPADRAIAAYYQSVRKVDHFDTKAHARALDTVARALPQP